jgi:hypothetical protein
VIPRAAAVLHARHERHAGRARRYADRGARESVAEHERIGRD